MNHGRLRTGEDVCQVCGDRPLLHKAPWVYRKSGLHRDIAHRGFQFQQSSTMNLRYNSISLFTSYTLIHSHNVNKHLIRHLSFIHLFYIPLIFTDVELVIQSLPTCIFLHMFIFTHHVTLLLLHLLCVSSASLLISLI